MAKIGTQVSDAVYHLKCGQIIGIPTETVYGLAANAFDEKAVLEIFKVKKRPSFDPLIVHSDSLEKVSQYVSDFPDTAHQLAKEFWPGPLTLVLPKKNIIPDLVTSGMDTVAVRIPNHPLALELLSQLDFPLAAPSANPFGYISPTSPIHVNDQLGDKITFILDGGPSEIGLESTIVKVNESGATVLRLGGISLERIEETVGPVSTQLSQGSNPQAAGMLDNHYAPAKRLYLGEVDKNIEVFSNLKVATLSFKKEYPKISSSNQIQLSKSGDLDEAARNLFGAMRHLDNMDVDVILAEKFPDQSIGKAINDRLRRASHIKL
jgi:L-threonylcarbamoyladenylate synthase